MGLEARIWASRLEFGPQDWDLGLQAWIWALRLGFGPQGWDLDLETGIWASRLEFGPRDWDLRGERRTEKEEDKIPHMCESLGHRPLWGHCPKVECDGPTDRCRKQGVESRRTRLKIAMLVQSISMYSECRQLGNTREFLLG